MNKPMKKVLNPSTQFKPSIFKEGMRQIKIFGIAYTLICAIVSIILVLDDFPFKNASNQHNVIAEGIPGAVEDFIVCILLFSAVFIFGTSILLFSFLRSHKARDFYCSTPNSICTIWLSFVTSIMTWAAIGVAVANIIQLPFLMTADVKYFTTWLLTFIGILAIDLLVCGIMSLASALTGRIIPMLITAAAVLLLPVSIYMLATVAFDGFFSHFDFVVQKVTYWEVYYDYRMEAITSAPLIFGCLLLGIIYLALAAWFMTVRTGDAAGKPFVNRAAHLISLLSVSFVVTSFVASWLTYGITATLFWSNEEEAMFEIVSVSAAAILAVVVSFWAANVILTFDIKKSHRMLKYLPISFAFCAVVFGAGFAVSNADFRTIPSADEIKSFTLVRNDYLNDNLAIYRMSDSYGRIVTENTEFTDKKVIDYIAGEVDKFIKEYDTDFRQANEDYSPYSAGKSFKGPQIEKINFKINLKDGRSITRAIPTNDAFLKDLVNAIENDSEYMDKFLSLPDAQNTNILVTDGYSGTDEVINDEDTVKLYECFAKEFAALSDNKKLEYLKSNLYSSYDNELYYDEACDEFYDVSQEGYSEYVDTEQLIVSGSDVDFVIVDKTEEKGEYQASMYNYISMPGFNNVKFLHLSLCGYKDGKFYDSDNYFQQSFKLTPAIFPETCSLLTQICNKNINSFIEIPDKITDDLFLTIDAYYYNGKNMLQMNYQYIDKTRYDDIVEMKKTQGENSHVLSFYSPYYGNTDDEGNPIDLKEFNISGKEYVQKLFDDAAKTTDVDLSKPYCKLYMYFSPDGRKAQRYSIYIQTESLMDLVVNKQDTAE